MKTYLEKLLEGKNLTSEECEDAVLQMEADPQAGAFLALLRAKGETAEELLGFVRALRKQAKRFDARYPILDIVGTGGDGAGTVNISTGSAILAARCGIPVVKHGGRAVSSKAGSADVLEALGFSFADPEKNLKETGFAFCLASDFHPMMQKIRPVRQSLKIPTLFNILGPLLNPAGLSHMMIGVFRPEFVRIVAETLYKLGTKRSLVFHGYGLDELTCIGPTEALLVTEKGIEPLRIDPVCLGLKLCQKEDLLGGNAEENAMLLGAALTGSSPLSDTLALNAGVGAFLYGAAATLQEGVSIAKQALKRKSLHLALKKNPKAIIGEIKRASPSKGKIGEIPDPAERATLYVGGGAAAISVLTSAKFEGTLQDLGAVAKSLLHTQIPILRKDFVLEPIHIAQAAAHGADAVLLIASFLKERTQEMFELASRMGLDALIEVHDVEDLGYFRDAKLIGVNQRNLTDFTMHPELHALFVAKIPPSAIPVAASGISSPEEAEHLFSLGYQALLIGEALTRSNDPLQFLSNIRSGQCA